MFDPHSVQKDLGQVAPIGGGRRVWQGNTLKLMLGVTMNTLQKLDVFQMLLFPFKIIPWIHVSWPEVGVRCAYW